MKQKMKRVLVLLSMIACLFSLSACSNKADMAEDALDPRVASTITQSATSLLGELTSFSKEEADEMEASLRKQKETVLADGLVAWTSVMNDTGAFVGVISSEALQTDEGYESIIQAEFENRNAEFQIFYSANDQGLLPISIALSPEYTTGEKMEQAALNTLMGMGTVFLVLIFISLLIGGFKHINAFEQKMKSREAVNTPAPAAVPVEEAVEELTDDLELVAVITAAIAASEGTSADGLVVRSIRRAPESRWKRA